MGTVYAKETASLRPCQGTGWLPRTVYKGEAFDTTDPLVKAKPALFSGERVDSTSDDWPIHVEQMTAAPGDRRQRG